MCVCYTAQRETLHTLYLYIYDACDILSFRYRGGREEEEKNMYIHIRRKMKGKRVASLGCCLAAGYGIAHTCAYCYIGYLRFLERERDLLDARCLLFASELLQQQQLSFHLSLPYFLSLSLQEEKEKKQKTSCCFPPLEKNNTKQKQRSRAEGLVNGFRVSFSLCVSEVD